MNNRGFWLTLTMVVLSLTLVACGGEPATPTLVPGSATAVPVTPDPTSPPLAAMVNGAPIYLEDFLRDVERQRTSRAALGISIPEDQALFEKEVLDQMIEAVLIEQAAAQLGITLSEAELDAEMAANIEDIGGSEKWNEWLTMNHLTPDEYREQLRTAILGSKLTAQIVEVVPEVAEQVHARHILVDLEGNAQAVLDQLNAGADFAELARRYSIDASTSETGGDLSWFARGQLLEPEVEEAAFALQAGETSPVITSRLGYHIIQTLERDPARPLSEEVRQNILQTTIERWRYSLWASATVERYVGAGS
ncbi:MAG: peptidylprolyl isomerase [Anaerolineae bacterium]|nr:peptidylprolyl isomerase [Anaerolineae bacterium]